MALWTPAEITTALWLDADDSSTITLESGAVSEWRDKSGHGRDLSQSNASIRPTIVAAAQNGRDLVRCGGGDRLEHTPTIAVGADQITVVSVLKVTSTAFLQSLPVTFTYVNQGRPFDRHNAITLIGSQQTASYQLNAVMSDFVIHIIKVTKDALASGTHAVEEWVDGVKVTDSSLTDSWSLTSQVIAFGGRNDTATRFIGDSAEEIAVDESFDAATREKVEGYLAHRWGLAGNLPAEHPYKSAAPEALDPSAIIAAPTPLLSPAVLGTTDAAQNARISAPSPLSAPSIYGLTYRAPLRISAPSPLDAASVYAINDFTGQLPGSPQIYYYARFNTGANKIVLPISSWQATLQSGERSSYVQCVVPAAEQYIDAITSAGAGTQLAIMRGAIYPGDATKEVEIASVLIDQFPYQRGPRRATVTLSGYGRLKFYNVDEESPPPSAIRQLPGVQTLTVHGGVRARCEIDWFLRPGMLAQADGVQFWVSYINYYANQNRQFMEVGERPL